MRKKRSVITPMLTTHFPFLFPPFLPHFPQPLTPTQMDTINRLLKKQAPKRRGKISAAELSASAAAAAGASSGTGGATHTGDDAGGSRDGDVPAANPVFVRWVSDRKGCRVGVPGEWLGKGVAVGRVFRGVEEEV